MAEELKPCPSCGATDVFLKEQKPVFFVACAYCSMQGPETLRKKGAIAEWNALPRKLPWTKEKPTVEGMYWCRCIDPCRRIAGPANTMYYTPGCKLIEMYDEFAGPIPEPEESHDAAE